MKIYIHFHDTKQTPVRLFNVDKICDGLTPGSIRVKMMFSDTAAGEFQNVTRVVCEPEKE